MKTVFIMWNYTHIGGIETLIIRISEALIKRGNKVIFGCNTYDDVINSKYINKLLTLGVEVIKIKKAKNDCISDIYGTDIYNFQDIKELLIIVFNYQEYFLAQNIQNKFRTRSKINILFYIVHPFLHTCRDINIKTNFIIKKIIKDVYKYLLLKLYKNNIIFFMDEESINFNENHYKIKLCKSYENIIRLPINIKEGNINIRNCSKSFNILTITRLDFPFKGYIIGLIQDFIKLKEKYKDITLTIIGDGPNADVMKQEIDNLDYGLRMSIETPGMIAYEDLNKYFDKANIYIGMGTTVLDAANNKLPALTVHTYTYKNITNGFFYENPKLLGGSHIYQNASDLIEEVLNMNDDEYKSLCNLNYQALVEIYDINIILEKMLLIKNAKELSISNSFIKIIFYSRKIGLCIKNIIKKLKRDDYE